MLSRIPIVASPISRTTAFPSTRSTATVNTGRINCSILARPRYFRSMVSNWFRLYL